MYVPSFMFKYVYQLINKVKSGCDLWMLSLTRYLLEQFYYLVQDPNMHMCGSYWNNNNSTKDKVDEDRAR